MLSEIGNSSTFASFAEPPAVTRPSDASMSYLKPSNGGCFLCSSGAALISRGIAREAAAIAAVDDATVNNSRRLNPLPFLLGLFPFILVPPFRPRLVSRISDDNLTSAEITNLIFENRMRMREKKNTVNSACKSLVIFVAQEWLCELPRHRAGGVGFRNLENGRVARIVDPHGGLPVPDLTARTPSMWIGLRPPSAANGRLDPSLRDRRR